MKRLFRFDTAPAGALECRLLEAAAVIFFLTSCVALVAMY